jgi:hypothetical protein
MNIKQELVKSLKNLVSAYFGTVYTDSQIKVSDKVVGGIVEMIAPDGTLTPAPDGDYAMENGFSFTVKDGAIIAIMGEEEVVEDMTDYKEPTMTGETKMDVTEDVVNIESSLFEIYNRVMEQENKIKLMEEKIMSMEEAIKGMTSASMESEKTISTFNKIVDELNTNIKTLANIPVQFSKVDTSVKNGEEKQEKLNNLVNILNKKSK